MPPDFGEKAGTRFQQAVADAPFFDPLAAIEADHALHYELCDMLEEIADSLPAAFRPERCQQALGTLRVDLPRHHADEEYGLFPLLKAVAEAASLGHALGRLEEDHQGDEANCDDLIPILELMANGEPPDNPEMVGYMLRGFFEAYRRHVAWENSIVLPLARKHLNAAAIAELRRVMLANRAAVGGLAGAATATGHGTTGAVRSLLRGLCGKADPKIGRR